jgi:hypothetical protein
MKMSSFNVPDDKVISFIKSFIHNANPSGMSEDELRVKCPHSDARQFDRCLGTVRQFGRTHGVYLINDKYYPSSEAAHYYRLQVKQLTNEKFDETRRADIAEERVVELKNRLYRMLAAGGFILTSTKGTAEALPPMRQRALTIPVIPPPLPDTETTFSPKIDGYIGNLPRQDKSATSPFPKALFIENGEIKTNEQ